MTDPIETAVKTDVTSVEIKFKDLWTHYGTYLIMAVCLVVGFIAGKHL